MLIRTSVFYDLEGLYVRLRGSENVNFYRNEDDFKRILTPVCLHEPNNAIGCEFTIKQG